MTTNELFRAHGNLELALLSMLKHGPMHGYGLILNLHRKYQAYYSPSVVYPLLIAFEKKGLVTSHWNTNHQVPRKEYAITAAGLQCLKVLQVKWKVFLSDFVDEEGILTGSAMNEDTCRSQARCP